MKDYIGRKKRNVIAQLQPHKINPELGIFKDKLLIDVGLWKKFNKDYHVTKVSIRALLEWGVPDVY